MIGVTFATMAEAGPFLELSRASQVDTQPFRIFQVPAQPALLVAISGMGKVAAALACQILIREFKVEEIVNQAPDTHPGLFFVSPPPWKETMKSLGRHRRRLSAMARSTGTSVRRGWLPVTVRYSIPADGRIFPA